MPIVGTAEVTVVANDSEFDSSLKAGTAAGLEDLAADADATGAKVSEALIGAGDAGGKGMGDAIRDGAGTGLAELGDEAESTGARISAALGASGDSLGLLDDKLDATKVTMGETTLIADALGQSEADVAVRSGVLAAAQERLAKANQAVIDTQTEINAGNLTGDAALEAQTGALAEQTAAKRQAAAADKELSASTDEVTASSDLAATSAEKSGKGVKGLLGSLGVPESLLGGWGALGLGLVAIGGVAIDLGSKMQGLTTNIAAWGGISVAQAGRITQAMLATAGTTIYSGAEQAKAYAGVVGQLTAVEGHTLTTAQAMTVMHAAMDLAEGSGESLGSATSSLAQVMQTYKLKVDDAKTASDQLFATAKGAGVSLSDVAQSVTQVHTQLGALTPPLGQTGALLVDMKEQGMNGSRALRVLGTAMTALIKPGSDVINSQNDLETAIDKLDPKYQALAQSYAKGTATSAQVTAATKTMTVAQAAVWGEVTKAQGAYETATQKQDAMGFSAFTTSGKFIGLKGVISDLYTQIKGLPPQQQLAILAQDGLASSAAKLLPVLNAGPAAFDKATRAVMQSGAAHAAAEKQSESMRHEWDLVKATAEDYETELGAKLIPVLTDVLHSVMVFIPTLVSMGKAFIEAGKYIADHKVLLVGLAAVLGSILIPMLVTLGITLAETAAAFVVEAAAAAAAWIATMGPIALVVAAIALVAMAVYEIIEHWSTITHFFEKIWGDVKHGVLVAWNDILAFFKKWGEDFLLAFLPVVGIPLFLATHWHQVEADAKAIWGDIVSFFSGIPGMILNALSSFGGLILHWIESALDDVKNWTVSALELYLHYWIELPIRIVQAVAPFAGMILGWIGSAFASLIGAVSSGIDDVAGFFKGLPGKILGMLGDAGTWLLGIGKDIMSGLIKGIENGEQDVLGAIKKVGSDISGAFKSVLSIFSPSKVFQSHGESLMEGLALGIEANANLPAKALTKVGQQLSAPNALKASVDTAGTAGAAPNSGRTVIVNVQPGAVTITGLDPTAASAASASVEDGFKELARELASGTAPTRIGAGA